jgi:hypothetical protein
MPQDGLFFRVLRRFNLIIATLLGLALLAGAGFVGWNVVKTGRPYPQPRLYGPTIPGLPDKAVYDVQLAPAETPKEATTTFRYSLYAMVRGASFEPGEFYRGPETVNLMDIDSKTGEGHWLFKGTNRNITMRDGVREGDLPENATSDSRPLVGLVLWVDENVTDKDKAPTLNRNVSVYYWKNGTAEPVKLLTAEDGVSTGQIDGKRYGIVYKKGGKSISVIYSVPDFKIVAEKTLPDVPN